MSKTLDYDSLRVALAGLPADVSNRVAGRALGISTWAVRRLRGPSPLQRDRADGPEIYASLVVAWIPVGPAAAPASGQALAESCGLTVREVQRGIAWLRDHYPALPLLSGPHGYQFSRDPGAIGAYRGRQLGAALTAFHRFWTGTMAPLLADAEPWYRDGAERGYTRLVEDIRQLERAPLPPARV